MNKLKENILTIITSVLLFAIVTLGGFYGVLNQKLQQAKTTGGFGFSSDQSFLITRGTATIKAGDPQATTTVVYLKTNDTASSTIIGYAGSADKVDLNLQAVASTSGTSVLQIFTYTSPNRIDWYKGDCYNVASTVLVTHSPSACIGSWTITGGGTQTLNVALGDVQSKYFKVDFGVTGANASLWAEARPRDLTPN